MTVFAQQDSLLNNKIIKNDNASNPKIETTANKKIKPLTVKIQPALNSRLLLQKKIDSTFSKQIFDNKRLSSFKSESKTIKKTTQPAEQARIIGDSLNLLIPVDSTIAKQADSLVLTKENDEGYSLLETYPIVKNNSVEYQITNFRNYESKDFLFYLLLSLVLIIAIVQAFFKKYLKNIFDIFFQPGFRQRQTKDQLSQEYLATFLLNILFILSTSIFITLISSSQIHNNNQFWQFLSLAFIILSITYIVKFSFTKFIGWLFHQQEVAESYNFLVFLIIKIIGVILVPLIILISYSSVELKEFSLTLSYIIIILLLLYRFLKAFNSIRPLLKINSFHFFIYFCSVEILPLFILFKAIGKYIGNGI